LITVAFTVMLVVCRVFRLSPWFCVTAGTKEPSYAKIHVSARQPWYRPIDSVVYFSGQSDLNIWGIRWQWVKTTQATIMGSSLEDSPMTLFMLRRVRNCRRYYYYYYYSFV